MTAPARSGSGATSSSARLRSIAFTTARATSSGRLVPTQGGSLAPDSANMPASLMKPGRTTETPTPLGDEVLAQRQREAAQAELGGRVDRGARRPGAPDSDDMNSRCPLPRATIGSIRPWASSIGARRLTASARSICSGEKEFSRPLPGSPAFATSTSTSPASASSRSGASGSDRSATITRPPISRGERLEHLGAAARQRQRRAARGQRPRDRLAQPTGRAGQQDTRTVELHANTATVAVKQCRKYPPPTGPISPAAKKPAAGAPASASATASASWSARPNIDAPAAVAGEHQRAGGRAAAQRGHADRQRLAQVAVGALGVAGVQAHDLAGVDVGGDRDLAGLRVGADEPAHEEVALQVVGLVGVHDDPDEQPALDQPQVLGRQRLDRLA